MLDLLLFILAEEDLPQEKILWLKKGGDGGVCVRGGGEPNNVGVNKSRLVRSYDERFSSCRNNQGTQKNSIKYEYIYYENDWISRRGEMKTHYSRYHHPCSDVLISHRVSYTPFYVCSPDKETNCASALSKSN